MCNQGDLCGRADEARYTPEGTPLPPEVRFAFDISAATDNLSCRERSDG